MSVISRYPYRPKLYLLSLDGLDEQNSLTLLENDFDAFSPECFSEYLKMTMRCRTQRHLLQEEVMTYTVWNMPMAESWQVVDIFCVLYQLCCKLSTLMECGEHTRAACLHVNPLGVLTIEADFEINM